MRKVIFIAAAMLASGCSSVGVMTAMHNGKKYWNPGNCDRYTYEYSNTDRLYCMTDGVRNGITLEPMDQQQLDNYYREQEISKGRSAGDVVQCSRFGDLSFNKEIRTFQGIACPVGWIESY